MDNHGNTEYKKIDRNVGNLVTMMRLGAFLNYRGWRRWVLTNSAFPAPTFCCLAVFSHVLCLRLL
jgi:hypothetical protein